MEFFKYLRQRSSFILQEHQFHARIRILAVDRLGAPSVLKCGVDAKCARPFIHVAIVAAPTAPVLAAPTAPVLAAPAAFVLAAPAAPVVKNPVVGQRQVRCIVRRATSASTVATVATRCTTGNDDRLAIRTVLLHEQAIRRCNVILVAPREHRITTVVADAVVERPSDRLGNSMQCSHDVDALDEIGQRLQIWMARYSPARHRPRTNRVAGRTLVRDRRLRALFVTIAETVAKRRRDAQRAHRFGHPTRRRRRGQCRTQPRPDGKECHRS